MRILGALLLALVALDAGAQGLTLFPASQYGKASLNLPQSTTGMSSVQLQNVLGRNANFERLDSYREQDRFRRIALPVGRLDLLVNGPMGSGVANCTASIISARHIITNNHCFPEGQGAVKQASLLMDFYSEDNEATAKRFEVKVVPVERNAELDFVIAEVAGNPSAIFGRIALEPRDPEPGESLLIIHHPMGMPKHMTRGGCRAHAPVAVNGTDIRHRCDTLPGSSGSPILSEGSGRMLGLHYGGSPNPGPNTWNFGKRLSEISGRSRVLAAAVAEQRQQEEGASRTASSQAAAERAEIEKRAREQAEAAARAEIDRLRAQLDVERARVGTTSPSVATPAPSSSVANPSRAAPPPSLPPCGSGVGGPCSPVGVVASVPNLQPPPIIPPAETPAEWAAAEVALGMTSARIREMQQHLKALGHDPRSLDGNLGPGTRTAIKSWQKSRGLRETGYASGEFLRLLAEAANSVAIAARPAAGQAPTQPNAIRSAGGRDCGICPEMIAIPAGSLGISQGGSIQVSRPFAISKSEITFGEWDACVEAGGCSHRPVDMGWGRVSMPVVNVSWDDIDQYIKWISGKTGRVYRLPSEAEWEFVAQAGGGVEAKVQLAGRPESCSGCGGKWDGTQPAPVASFSPNAMGVYDMLGNVSEWVADCWNDSPLNSGMSADKRVFGDCSRRVVKGGSWFLDSGHARSSYRSKMSTKIRSPTIGFRILREG